MRMVKKAPLRTKGAGGSSGVNQIPNRIRTSNRNRSDVCIRARKKRQYSRRVLDINHGTFTPLVFTTTFGVGRGIAVD